MANPAAQTQPKPKQAPAEPMHALAVKKGADGRYYAVRLVVMGDRVVESRNVADNFTLEGLMLDSTIRLRQLIGDVFNPLGIKR